MITYLLDTNICVYILKRKPFHVLQKFETLDTQIIGVLSITVAELMFGVSNSSSYDKNLSAVNELLGRIQILNFDEHAALQHGRTKAILQRKGAPIGPLYNLIAAHALSLNAILVSNNLREFNRVEGLLTENWAE